MKTQFFSYGGGLITGVLLVILFSASTEREKPELPTITSEATQQVRFHPVPVKQFFDNVANYRDQHAKLVRREIGKEPSRMFIYSVPTLEAFFKVIEAHGNTAQLNHDELAIRFYYAVYPKDLRIAGHDYGSLHTLYMIPNVWSEADQTYKDLDIRALANDVQKAKGYGNRNKNEVIKSYYLENIYGRQPNAGAFMLDGTALPYSGPTPSRTGSLNVMPPPVINQGQLCPPNCPDNSLLTYIDANF